MIEDDLKMTQVRFCAGSLLHGCNWIILIETGSMRKPKVATVLYYIYHQCMIDWIQVGCESMSIEAHRRPSVREAWSTGPRAWGPQWSPKNPHPIWILSRMHGSHLLLAIRNEYATECTFHSETKTDPLKYRLDTYKINAYAFPASSSIIK